MKTLADERCRAEIVRRLRTVRPESTRRWGRMSPHQMICHLTDGCRMATGLKSVTGTSSVLPRRLVKWIVLRLPVRWPAGVPTSPEIDRHCGGTRPVDFAADVAELVALLERMTTPQEGFEWPVHPVFGRMSRGEWLRWAYLHADHHFRQFGA